MSTNKDKIKKQEIVTRFAPSPTGFLHIGNARAALFNWLYARQNKGKFILRIEDTDILRSRNVFEEDIVESLRWLGLIWDEQFKQSKRLALYKKYLDQLLAESKAYEHGGAVYFNLKSQIANLKSVEFNDMVRGTISTPTKAMDDFVIVKSDSTPLFLFTNVVDDFEMGITQVIRGEDHISNTPRQILIAQALGISTPQYGHIPIVLATDKSKLSKRQGAVAVSEFRAQGYLPEALVNAMALLGWHPSEDREIFSLEELEKTFSLDRVQRGGAIFDVEKLNNLNQHYIKQLSNEQLFERLKPFVERLEKVEKNFALKVVAITKDRLTRLTEFEGLTSYLFDKISVDGEKLVFKKSTRGATQKGLQLSIQKLSILNSTQWTQKTIQTELEKVVKENKLTNGDVFWPVRFALSGQDASSSPAELAWALGKKETLERLNQAVKLLK